MSDRWDARNVLAVVGVSFTPDYPDNLHAVRESLDWWRDAAGHDYEGVSAVLIRNPDNPYDSNAVEVHVPAVGQIGHLNRYDAARLAPLVDAGQQFKCWVRDVRINPDHPDRPGIDILVQRAAETP